MMKNHQFLAITAVCALALTTVGVPAGAEPPAGAESKEYVYLTDSAGFSTVSVKSDHPNASPPAHASVAEGAAVEYLVSKGVPRAKARSRIGQQTADSRIADRLQKQFAVHTGGAYLDGTDVVLTMTDESKAKAAQAAGANRVQKVKKSLKDLDAEFARVDKVAKGIEGVSYNIDIPTNTVHLNIPEGTTFSPQLDRAITKLAADGTQVHRDRPAVQPAKGIWGGTEYWGGAYGCSWGFTGIHKVTGATYNVTAGHCLKGAIGSTITAEGMDAGTVSSAVFPGSDHGTILMNGQAVGTAQVSRYDGWGIYVFGMSEAAIGGVVCKSGFTTKWTCGVVKSKNATAGEVNGLTQTTACTLPGDSGGAVMAGSEAQGVTSMTGYWVDSTGKRRCLADKGEENQAWHQPITPALDAQNLLLLVHR